MSFLQASIIPNGNFTWGEALHNGQRLPGQISHFDNILALARAIQPYRTRSGKPWTVTSWYRPEPWNSQVGGVSNSRHLTGQAVDFAVDMSIAQVKQLLADWPGGFGVYPGSGHFHLDLGPRGRWG